MSTNSHLLRGAVALLFAGIVAGCGPQDNAVLGPQNPAGGAMFRSYVSLGNSITAGFQSGGINDSTQRRAYPVLLAQSMGTPFIYPSLNMPGCPPPVANFQTGALVGPPVPGGCALRNTSLGVFSDHVNNVAVPGASAIDPTLPTTSCCSALTTFILGGMTQVQRALQAKPTFATVWMGNNDVLGPALAGILTPTPGITAGVTPLSAFVPAYASMMSQLTTGAPGLKGVLIAVVQVSHAAALTPGYIIAASPQLQGAISVASCGIPGCVQVMPNCTGSPSLIDLIRLIPQIQAFVQSGGTTGHPPVISCVKGQFPPSPLVGDIFVLDSAEQVSLLGTINQYNAYIKAKADSLGWAYYDPNTLLNAWDQSGAVPLAPNFLSPTQPFGQYVSLDGIHPSSAAHVAIANDLIAAINGKFGTNLRNVQ